MDLSLSGQSRDAEGRRPAAHPGLGPWVGARVASPRCPILRPGPSSLLPSTATTQFRVGSPPTRRTLNDSVNRSQGSKSRLAIPPPSSLGGISPGKYPLGPMVLPPHRQPYGGPAMRDIAFFSRLLALEKPWRVKRVSLDPKHRSIDIQLVHRRNASFSCPECGCRSALYDHVPSRSWRHLDHGGCPTWLHAQIPRVDCSVHGIRRVHVPWALPGARFTTAFERHAIDVLLEADILGSARLLRISWDEAWHIMERAVERGLRAKPCRIIAHLGVTRRPSPSGTAMSRWCATWTGARWNTSPTTASGPAWTPTISRSRRSNWRASRPWPWTCGSRSSPRPRRMSPTVDRRSSSTASIS